RRPAPALLKSHSLRRGALNIGIPGRQSIATGEIASRVRPFPLNRGPVLVAKNLHLRHFPLYSMQISGFREYRPDLDMNDVTSSNEDAVEPAARPAGHQPALTGCPWHDVNEMLQAAGLRPTRQRMALGW